jgi:hypothetical protein
MQIQLKQNEIEEAISQFVSQQGISLSGKTVSITFISGRKDNGLSAEVTIESSATNGKPLAAIPRSPEIEEPAKLIEDIKEVVPTKAASLFK